MADEQIQELRVRNDQICEELGLPKFQRDEQRQSRGMSNAECYTTVKGESWKLELMRVIDECMRCAGNREELQALHRRSMSKAWQLETSVMVTERNWSALLDMQDRLFRP